MLQIPLVISSTITPTENFWNSILIYHNRPHIINRKIATIKQLVLCETTLNLPDIKPINEIFTREALLYEIRKLANLTVITPQFIKNLIQTHDKNVGIKETSLGVLQNNTGGSFISIRVLFSRKNSEQCLEIAILDKTNNRATFFAVQEKNQRVIAPPFPYHLQLTPERNFKIILNTFEDADTASADWLADKLFPKLIKWSEEELECKTVIKSLTLVEPDEYCLLYSKLKSKYAQDLVGAWPDKAKTDPQKYVFEDLAITAYLMCLWRKNGDKNVNFVDCGCGNGLLVYILNQEGFQGYGLDLRRRSTWDIYGDKADLRIGTLTPSSTFPETTWIIGNHSDELTPWIPVIALKSSPKTNYFVLPCCSYDFNGKKFVRTNTGISQYQDYLNYVTQISELCGFHTEIDKLRIPSTKRVCLIGRRERFEQGQLIEIENFIDHRLNGGFVARNSVEKVRNCTHLNRSLIERIVHSVVNFLLKTSNKIEGWNKGGVATLVDLIGNLSSEDLKSLKNEGKGLQTLLKNHRYIFEIKNGKVELRPPQKLTETKKYRDKACWFHQNHPDGCLNSNDNCAYKH